MLEDIKQLETKFNIINNRGWVKSLRKGATGIGYTFECLINKKEDCRPLPDFKSIEIKTIRNNSIKKIHLFSVLPDGDCDNPVQRMLSILGYRTKSNNKLRCCVNVYANKYTQLGYYKFLILNVDEINRKIELLGVNNFNNSLNLNISWSFKLLEERVENKLMNLALIHADNKFINSNEYFHYSNIQFYTFKGFDVFLNYVKDGTIDVGINIGEINGKYYSHGVFFSIKEKDLCKIYYPIIDRST